jgi:endonuclease/exonuclease/phosphatase family metal-dependent hydrolase
MAFAKQISQFRMGTINVHFFCNLKDQSNVHHLANLLNPMSFDVLAIQEALHTDKPPGVSQERHYHLKLLSELLELPHIAFCNTSYEFGNAILSRIPFTNSVEYCTEAVKDHSARGMLGIQLDNEFFKDNNATLYVTHLDQINEQLRLKQMNQFEEHIRDVNGLQLIAGDFNALTFDDYSDDYFNIHIHDVRQRNSWEGPQNLLTNQMKKNGYHDCWREMNKDAINDDVVTCIYKTRIDYIWRRGELQNGWKINECKIFSTENATDHNGILIDFIKTS